MTIADPNIVVWSPAEVVTVIAATAAGVVSVITALTALGTRRHVRDVHHEVRTLNSLTIGQLAAQSETRRILAEPEEERTHAENVHLQQVPLAHDDTDPGPG